MAAKSKDNKGKGFNPATIQRFFWDALKRGDSRKLGILIQAGANVSDQGPTGSPPLVEAARRQRSACVEVLLACPGIDPAAISANGWTALRWALATHNRTIVAALLEVAGFSSGEEVELMYQRMIVERVRAGGPWTKHVSEALGAATERHLLRQACSEEGIVAEPGLQAGFSRAAANRL